MVGNPEIMAKVLLNRVTRKVGTSIKMSGELTSREV